MSKAAKKSIYVQSMQDVKAEMSALREGYDRSVSDLKEDHALRMSKLLVDYAAAVERLRLEAVRQGVIGPDDPLWPPDDPHNSPHRE